LIPEMHPSQSSIRRPMEDHLDEEMLLPEDNASEWRLQALGRAVRPRMQAVRPAVAALCIAALGVAAVLGAHSVAGMREPTAATKGSEAKDLVHVVKGSDGDEIIEHKVSNEGPKPPSSGTVLSEGQDLSKKHKSSTHAVATPAEVRALVAPSHKPKKQDTQNASVSLGSCNAAGEDCRDTGCCQNGEGCISGGYKHGIPEGWMRCQKSHHKFEVKWVPREPLPQTHTTWKAHGVTCHSRFVAPPMPEYATQHNGVTLPPVCINETKNKKGKKRKHHVFVISDWGGVLPGHKGNNGKQNVKHLTPADHTPFGAHIRDRVKGTDEWAQHRVARAMKKRAKKFDPDYYLQGGDAFYWGGLETQCGTPMHMHPDNGQTNKIFEEMYTGKGVDGKQWLGVLGNHDYGGWMYIGAWDQVVGYTWGGPGSTGRWMMPAQYWAVEVYYPDFIVDYYFMDTNNFDTMSEKKPSLHNLCNMYKVGHSESESCGKSGPSSAAECHQWFQKLWADQKHWLKKKAKASKADWQIVVTHFPPTWGHKHWTKLARDLGLDLIITGHKHQQEVHVPGDKLAFIDGWGDLYNDFMEGTSWLVSGGGGGVTSQGTPDDHGEDDQYGFMHLTLSRYEIRVRAISHGGQLRHDKKVRQRHPAIATPDYLNYLTPQQRALEMPAKDGCGTKEFTFYLYRAQDDHNYGRDENVNAANLAGVLWYLHHEVVMTCPRKFGITRLRRLLVTMRNTCDLYKDTKSQFGPYSAFDSGRCGVKGCEKAYEKYGNVIGCQHIPYNTGLFAAYCEQPNCGYAQWYSFPGTCLTEPWGVKTKKMPRRQSRWLL